MQIKNKNGNEPARNFLLSAFAMVLAFHGSLPIKFVAAQQGNTPENRQASATAEQKATQGVKDILATITQSRSTNSRGYKLVINEDGSATAEIGSDGAAVPAAAPQSRQFPPGAIDAKTLQRLLAEIGDVSRIPTGSCIKSASFGTRTQITYSGKTSGDLQCIQPPGTEGDATLLQASEELGRFVQTLLGHLKINDRHGGLSR